MVSASSRSPGMQSLAESVPRRIVKVDASGLYTYPDVVIVCDEPQFEDGVMDTLLNPRVLLGPRSA